MTSPLRVIPGPSKPQPPSAMNAIRVQLVLYHETGFKKHLKEIAGIISYVKMYAKIMEGKTKKERKQIIKRPRWECDIEDLCVYGMCCYASCLALAASSDARLSP